MRSTTSSAASAADCMPESVSPRDFASQANARASARAVRPAVEFACGRTLVQRAEALADLPVALTAQRGGLASEPEADAPLQAVGRHRQTANPDLAHPARLVHAC